MARTVCIKNAGWVIAWDAAAKRHAYLTGGDVVFTGSKIDFVGRGWTGKADETVDGNGLMVMPGLINVHSHPNSEPLWRGIREEHGVPEMYMSGLYERSLAYAPDDEGKLAGIEVAFCELLKSGVTSVTDISGTYPGWLDVVVKSGIRGFVAPSYASSRWKVERSHLLEFNWDEATGRRRFEAALKFIDEAGKHPSGRLSGVVSPAQIDTCTEDLLRDSIAAARERKIPFTVHCSQSVAEFHEMVRRHGVTPVQWANDLGLLGPGTILGHAIFIDEHSWLHWWSRKDLALIADTGTSVAHCPSPFARYGQTLQDFGRYVRAGVNMGMGTDVAPHNLIEEMRWAAVLARVSAENIKTLETADVFRAGTVGGATALLRDDLGRLAPGMKADIVLVDLANEWMQPARDPLRSLFYTAADRAVRDVYVDGTKVVERGKVLTLDHQGALERLSAAQKRMERTTPERDPRHRRSDEISPLSLPML